MKRIFRTAFFIALVSATMFVACKKDESKGEEPTPPPPPAKAAPLLVLDKNDSVVVISYRGIVRIKFTATGQKGAQISQVTIARESSQQGGKITVYNKSVDPIQATFNGDYIDSLGNQINLSDGEQVIYTITAIDNNANRTEVHYVATVQILADPLQFVLQGPGAQTEGTYRFFGIEKNDVVRFSTDSPDVNYTKNNFEKVLMIYHFYAGGAPSINNAFYSPTYDFPSTTNFKYYSGLTPYFWHDYVSSIPAAKKHKTIFLSAQETDFTRAQFEDASVGARRNIADWILGKDSLMTANGKELLANLKSDDVIMFRTEHGDPGIADDIKGMILIGKENIQAGGPGSFIVLKTKFIPFID